MEEDKGQRLTSLRRQVQPVVVVGAERTIALGALALSRFVPGSQTVVTEHVETLGQYGILPFDLAGRAGERFLVLANFLQHDLVDRGAGHFDLLHAFRLALELGQFLLEPFGFVRFRFQRARLFGHHLLGFLHLGVVLFEMQLQIGSRLGGLDGFPFVHFHRLLTGDQFLLDRGHRVLQDSFLFLQLTQYYMHCFDLGVASCDLGECETKDIRILIFWKITSRMLNGVENAQNLGIIFGGDSGKSFGNNPVIRWKQNNLRRIPARNPVNNYDEKPEELHEKYQQFPKVRRGKGKKQFQFNLIYFSIIQLC